MTADALEECDAVVIPSAPQDPQKRVKSPNRVVQALRAGRFVAASPLPSYAEFEPFAWIGDDLAAGLLWLCGHPAEAEARIAAGQTHISSRYSPAAIALRWHDALTRLMRS